jgi:hypothetical protein
MTCGHLKLLPASESSQSNSLSSWISESSMQLQHKAEQHSLAPKAVQQRTRSTADMTVSHVSCL